MNKHPFLTIVLGFIPGFGHLYAGRLLRAFLYGFSFFGFVFLTVFSQAEGGGHGATLLAFVLGVIVWFINLIDLIIYVTGPRYKSMAGYSDQSPTPSIPNESQQSERFFTMLSSIIPGLGHFQLGLMQRGLSFLVAFFGVIMMILFVRYVTHLEGVFVFLLAVPIIWLYGLFDTMQLLLRKQQGEVLMDRTIFDEFEEGREVGKKSKTLAIILSVLPGAGHMYLGLQQRGLQLMAGFLFSFYILDALHLSIFLFLIPIVWCYSLFDAMQHVSRHDVVDVKDVPIRQIGVATNPKGAMNVLAGMRDRVDRNAIIAEAQVPVLLIAGEADQIIPLEKAFFVKGPHVTQVTIADAGHMSMQEQPTALIEQILTFANQIYKK